MTRNCRRFLCFVLAAVMLAVLLPASVTGNSAKAEDTLGKTIKDQVNFRVGPSMRDKLLFKVSINTVCIVLGQVTANGYSWYKVEARDPSRANAYLQTGYIRSDCFRLLTAEEAAAYTGVTPSAVTPSPSETNTQTDAPAGTVGYVTSSGVNFRAEPNGQVIESLNSGTQVNVLTIPSVISSQTWYKVEYQGRTGYIMSTFLNLYGTDPVVTAVPQPTATPNPDALGYVMTIVGSVNIRASIGGTSLTTVGRYVTMPYLLTPVRTNNYTWYFVQVSPTLKGYIRGDCVKVVSGPGGGGGGTVVTPTPTPIPSTATGYVKTTIDYVNVRKGIWGTLVTVVQKAGTTFPYYGQPRIDSNNVKWYYIYSPEFGYAYIHGNFVTLTDGGGDVVTPTPTPYSPETATPTPYTPVTPTPQPSTPLGYLKTTIDAVNVRTDAWGTLITTVQKAGTVFPYYGIKTASGNNWYYIYSSSFGYGYILGKYIKLTDEGGSIITAPPVTQVPVTTAPPVTPTPTATTPSSVTPTPTPAVTSAPGTPTGYLKTTTDSVNVRKDAWGQLITTVEKAGTVFPYYGEPKVVSGNNWYYIYSPSFGYGYILGKFVKLTDEGGAVLTPTPTPEPGQVTPTPTPEPGTTPAPSYVTEASYTTLKAGSSGPAVQNLVTELINQGYYKYALTSKYTSSVETAVRSFQAAKGLAVDGIAGEQTQHTLFNTVPVGTADHTNLTMTLYPAEKIDWYTGGINELWSKGSNVKVYDVYTGLVWWAHRWSGGLHVDAEPLTAADTATLCRIYGVSKASDIKENTHWQRRPCLITIGTRTFACSLYGVPHNEEGNTIKNNNFNGQLCIHFTNSKIHKSGKVDSKHEEAINYAWENAPNGHK